MHLILCLSLLCLRRVILKLLLVLNQLLASLERRQLPSQPPMPPLADLLVLSSALASNLLPPLQLLVDLLHVLLALAAVPVALLMLRLMIVASQLLPPL